MGDALARVEGCGQAVAWGDGTRGRELPRRGRPRSFDLIRIADRLSGKSGRGRFDFTLRLAVERMSDILGCSDLKGRAGFGSPPLASGT